MNSKNEIEIQKITYTLKSKTHTATPISEEKRNELGLTFGCNCGDEKCINGWVYRCMAGGGGSCIWFETNEVC